MFNKLLKVCLLVSLPIALLTAKAYAEQLDIYWPQTITIHCAPSSGEDNNCKIIKTSPSAMSGFYLQYAGETKLTGTMQLHFNIVNLIANNNYGAIYFLEPNVDALVIVSGTKYKVDSKHGHWRQSDDSWECGTGTVSSPYNAKLCPFHFK